MGFTCWDLEVGSVLSVNIVKGFKTEKLGSTWFGR